MLRRARMDSFDPPLRKRAPSAYGARTCFEPPVDVYRVDAGWLCKFDLAGVALDDVEVRVEGSSLVVSGVRRDRCTTGMRAWSLEIAYSRFERAVRLPCDLTRADIACESRDGLLLVVVRQHGG